METNLIIQNQDKIDNIIIEEETQSLIIKEYSYDYFINYKNEKNNLNLQTKNSKTIQLELLEMGFDLLLINKILENFKIISTEQTLEYLTKNSEGKWNHPFVSIDIKVNPQNFESCRICGEEVQYHYMSNFNMTPYYINSSLSEESIQDKRITNKADNNFKFLKNLNLNFSKDIKNEILCEICMGEISDKFILECFHFFCFNCISDYILNKINNLDIENISCPIGNDKCSYIFTEEIIQVIIFPEEFIRFLKFKNRKKISHLKGIIHCPIPDCESFSIIEKIEKNSESSNFLHEKFNKYLKSPLNFNEKLINEINFKLNNNTAICLDNNHQFCLKCKHNLHEGKTCEIGIDSEFNKLIKEKINVKRCPECKFYIEKNEGCNHMTCSNIECKYEFCWICMKKYNPNHYNNPFTLCFSLSTMNQNSFFMRHQWALYLRYFGMFIYKIILYLLISIFVPFILAVMVGEIFSRRIFSRNSFIQNLSKILYYLTFISLGIGLYFVYFYIIAISPLIGIVFLLRYISS